MTTVGQLLFITVVLVVLSEECQASRWQYNCTGQHVMICCQLHGNSYNISVADAEYGQYDNRESQPPVCGLPDLHNDCRQRVEDIHPTDYEEITEACHGETECIVPVKPSNLECEGSSISGGEYLIIYYHCTDNGVVITSPAPSTTQAPITTTTTVSSSFPTTTLPDTNEDDGGTDIGLIIGLTLGILLLIILIVILIYLIYRYRNTKKDPTPHVEIETNYTYEQNPVEVEEWRTPPPSKRLSVAFAYDNKAYEDELKIVPGKTTKTAQKHYENVDKNNTEMNGAVGGQMHGDVKTANTQESRYEVPGQRASMASNVSAQSSVSSLPIKPPLDDDSTVKRASIASNSSWASSLGGRSSVTGAGDSIATKHTSVVGTAIPEESEDTTANTNTVVKNTQSDKNETEQADTAVNTKNHKYENLSNSQQHSASTPVKPTRNSKLSSQGNLSRMSLASVGQSYETIGSQATSVATEATAGHYEDVELKT